MNGIVDDILQLEKVDFKALVETRIVLELKTVKLASLRRTTEDLKSIKSALNAYSKKVLNNENAVQEDLLFHLAIAKAAKNSALNSFLLKLTPEIITNFATYHVCDDNLAMTGIDEHTAIYEAIKDQNPALAKEKMKLHFKTLYQYCYNIK